MGVNPPSNSTQQEHLAEIARQEYLEDRKQRIELHNQASQSLDKTLLSIAGGALGLSFTFIRQIVP